MKIALICEGFTDYILMQYVMNRLYGWNDSKESSFANEKEKLYAREMGKNEDILTVMSSGGSSGIKGRFESVLKNNTMAARAEDTFSKIIILTDNDDENTMKNVADYAVKSISQFSEDAIYKENSMKNKKWFSFTMKNGRKQAIDVSLLPLVIPFDENGALETLLLKALAEKDSYDRKIIEKGNVFVDSIDPETRYLKGRRRVVKAKFDIYFSIRTSAEQYGERRNILKGIRWEDYDIIKNTFAELAAL